MKELRQAMGFSFPELEMYLFQRLQEAFGHVFKEVIEELDELILHSRDKKRYEVKDLRSGTVTTLLGDVSVKRRYYMDLETREYVYLLDEILDVKVGQASPCLSTIAAIQAVIGPSYRAARESLSQFFGHQVLSHETIRSLLIRMGKQVDIEEAQKRRNPVGKRKVPVLYVEADGFWVSMQRSARSRREIKMVVVHEGWQKITPGSDEYELVNKTHYLAFDSKDFWDDASRHIYSRYDIDEDTMVIINGDRAPWIAEGVAFFPKSMYQVDRYHLIRDIKQYLRGTGEVKASLNAVANGDIKALHESLVRAKPQITNRQYLSGLKGLIRQTRLLPEPFRDYRMRLKERGYDVTGMRGMGAAESNVDRFSNRLKKRGRSWGPSGLKSMLLALVKHFEGTLDQYAKRIVNIQDILSLKSLDKKIRKATRRVSKQTCTMKQGGVPIKRAGTTRSGGLSQLFLQLERGNMLLT